MMMIMMMVMMVFEISSNTVDDNCFPHMYSMEERNEHDDNEDGNITLFSIWCLKYHQILLIQISSPHMFVQH